MIISITLLVLLTFSIIPHAYSWSQQVDTIKENQEKHKEVRTIYRMAQRSPVELPRILILYDSNNKIIDYSAQRVYFMLRVAYPNVQKLPIVSPRDMSSKLSTKPFIAIILLNSTFEGVYFGNNMYSWEEFARELSYHYSTQLVIVTGNTYKLSEYKLDNWYFDEYEYTSLSGAEVFAVWEPARLIREFDIGDDELADDVEAVAIKYYVENMGNIFEENINPRIKLGVKDPEYRSRYLEEYLARHPDTMKIVVHDNGEIQKPLLFGIKGLLPADSNGEVDFFNLPRNTSLKGPVGNLVELIFSFLRIMGVETLTLSSDTVNKVVEIFKMVYDVIGDPSKLGDGSLLKEFLNLLKSEFPYIENYTKYFDLFIDGYYALKGDINSIISFITNALNMFLPDSVPYLNEMLNILNQMFSVGSQFLEKLESITDLKLSMVMDWVSKLLTNKTIQSFGKELMGELGVSESTYNSIVGNVSALVSLAIDLMSMKNPWDFANRLFKYLTEELEVFNNQEVIDTINKTRALISFLIAFINKDEGSIRDMLISVAKSYIESTYISDYVNMVSELIEAMDQAIKKARTDVMTFYNEILGIINKYINVPSPPQEVTKAVEIISKTITTVTAIVNGGFDIKQVVSIPEILELVLEQFISDQTVREKIFTLLNATLLPFASLGSSSRILAAFYKEIDFEKDYKQMLIQALIDGLQVILEEVDPSININQIIEEIENIARIGMGIWNLIGEIKDRPIDGIFTLVMLGASYAPVELFGDKLNIKVYAKMLEALLPDLMGLAKAPSLEEATDTLKNLLSTLGVNQSVIDTVLQVMSFLYNIKDVVRDGIKWLTNKVLDWLSEKISNLVGDLVDKLLNELRKLTLWTLTGDFNLPGFGGMDAITLAYNFTFNADVSVDRAGLKNDIYDMVTKGKYLDLINPINAFWTIIKRIQISPVFTASMELKSAFSDDNDLMKKVLDALGGVSIKIEGEAKVKLILFTFKSGSFDPSSIMDLEQFKFWFKLEIGKTFTIFDLIGASTLGSIAKQVGLDGITVTLSLGLEIEIVLGSSSTSNGDQSTLSIELTIAGTLHIGFDIVVAEVSLDFTLSIGFRFKFAIMGDPKITFTIEVSWKLKIHLEFLFVGKTFTFQDTPFSYTFPAPGEKPEDKATGFDSDGDGLADNFEKTSFGFAPNRTDTDMDGIPDNDELNGYGTDPLDPDTDGDGLTDYEEIVETKTNPFNRDTDSDKLSDYLEAKVYGTNPNAIDTDGDGLDDYFEVTYKWDISSVTISITGVKIGDNVYYDHTDPRNPDTDGDGLLDGQEGPMGGYYGDAAREFGNNPIIFNYGYTHPLDNDTDDDSYLQYWDGRIHEDKIFLRSMTDKEEIDGISAIMIEDGDPVTKVFRTNPVCPDTDQDTSSSAVILNSDSYELSLDPPTDPLDGDTDDDGIIDGSEGVAAPDTNKTDPLNPDTDGDGLGDLQEILLGLDPGNMDSDYDMVSDGEEYLVFGTNPRLSDSDFDGLTDGEELFFWHSNPMLKDSDNDGLTDGEEVLIYFTNPMDEDTDRDGLLDTQEIFLHNTNPLENDSDYDGLMDGEEVLTYFTDPLNWDTDNDSILYLNENMVITWSMSDYEEVMIYHTDPLLTDTDRDGISDGFELYLASGKVPWMEPMFLDPLNNDTDGDGLLDGIEMRIVNTTNLIYPYISLNLKFPFNSSPVLYDTDGDGLNDFIEVNATLSPNNTDTDGDGLNDYEEFINYGTDPTYWDTDYDNVSDYDEIMGFNSTYHPGTNITTMALYHTDPLNNDTDGDYLFDGYEVFYTGTNPMDNDTDDDGVLDGYEFDSDGDGLSDGEEMGVVGTANLPNGGPWNPDSDGDGLSDGAEVNIYHTNATNPDSDGDGIPDGAEVAAGTDPNSPTTSEEYNNKLNMILSGLYIAILTPNGELKDRFTDVRAINGSTMTSMWFRFQNGTEWYGNYTMHYDSAARQWVYNGTKWSPGKYKIEVYGVLTNGTIVKATAEFTYEYTEAPGLNPWLMLAAGIGIGVALVFFVMFVLPKILEMRKKKKNGGEVK